VVTSAILCQTSLAVAVVQGELPSSGLEIVSPEILRLQHPCSTIVSSGRQG
jgi:hypothetical protein